MFGQLDCQSVAGSNTPLAGAAPHVGGPSGPIAANDGQVAQLVEQRTENPRVGGSIPPLATINFSGYSKLHVVAFNSPNLSFQYFSLLPIFTATDARFSASVDSVCL